MPLIYVSTTGPSIDCILEVNTDHDLYQKHLSASTFHKNRVNKEFDTSRLLDFFKPQKPVAHRKWFFGLTKWRLVKCVVLPEDLGFGDANERAKTTTKTEPH